MTDTVQVDEIRRIDRKQAPALATAEYRRFVDLLRSLEADEWGKPTECAGWDVRAMVAHVLGAAEANTVRSSMREMRRGKKAASEIGGELVDGINAVQVRDRAGVVPGELVARLAQAAPKAVEFRRRTPLPMRLMRVPAPFVGKITMGYLVDVVYTRDVWMHRVDVARATGAELVLTPDHDGRLVADVVAEWAERHGRPFTLVLEGPAGGAYAKGSGGEDLRLDAVEFCRVVSGRGAGAGLLDTKVVF